MIKNNNKKRKYVLISTLVIFLMLGVPIISALYLNDLVDVNTDTAISCNILHYNGTYWVNWDLWNESITWYKPHSFLDIITAKSYYGDGGNLTNITASAILPSYLTNKGHPHNQDLNTTNRPTFTNITLSSLINWYYLFTHLANWNNLTDIPLWLTNKAHPHNQDLNTTSNVTFNNLTIKSHKNNGIYLGELNECILWLSGVPHMTVTDFEINAKNTDAGLSLQTDSIDALQIDNNGIITLPKQSATRVRLLNGQSVNSGIMTKLQLTVNDYDLNSDWQDLNNRFIVPVNGLYMICYSVTVTTNLADTNKLISEIYKNGVGTGGYVCQTASTTSVLANSGSDILQLSANDYIELYVYQNSGIAKTFGAVIDSNYLSICKIA